MLPFKRHHKLLLALLVISSLAIAAVRAIENPAIVSDSLDEDFEADDDFDFDGENVQVDQLLGNVTLPPPLGADYGAPNYQQPLQISSYGQQQAPLSYQPPVTPYEQPQQLNYALPIPVAPVQYQQQQAPTAYQPKAPVAYQAPVKQPHVYEQAQQQPIVYQNYSQSKPVYQQPQPVVYQNYSQPPQLPVYQQPQPVYLQPQPVYQQPQPVVNQNYSQPPQLPVYQQPQPVVYQNYTQPAPLPVYQPPQPVVYQNYSKPAPVYQQPQPVVYQNYTQPAPLPVYQPPQPVVYQNYSKPAPVYQQAKPAVPSPLPLPVQSPQVAKNPKYQLRQVAPVAQKPHGGYIQSHGNVTSASGYLTSLLSLTKFENYMPNTPNSYYFKASPYQACPKNVYLNGPSQADIQEAFRQAKLELAKVSQSSINYIDSTQKSFAARHAFFSFLSQHSPRMDEEGLLVEYVSQYLAQRACLTKWDKQRYLPQLTKLISVANFPQTHSCASLYQRLSPNVTKYCVQSKYRTYDGFCNNPYHPYWGKANVCHIRLMSPDYADGISAPRVSYNPQVPLPNPRALSNYIHNDVPLDGLYNLMKMQWGQFINHDITNTALSSYDGLVDCCKNPQARGCWPIYIPPGDPFYQKYNVTCLNFIRSGVCALCQLGPRQQSNKNTAFLDLSHIYGNTQVVAMKLRLFRGGLLIETQAKNGEPIPPLASGASQDQCTGICFQAGDNRINQHPALTALHTLLLRRHNQHARALARRHPDWNDENLYQEARRLAIAEYQMVTYGEYFPIVFGPTLSAYYNLYPLKQGNTYFNPKVDPTTWNEYSTATCRFGHSQIAASYGLYNQLTSYKQQQTNQQTFRLKNWFMQPSFIYEGLTKQIVIGLLSKPSDVVDPWITGDVREHLYKHAKDHSGGDLAATNIWRGRDHGIPGYINYLEFCFNFKVYSWKDLELFIPPQQLGQLKKIYGVVENIDLFTGGLAERHFPGADTGPTFACVNGIQYYHLKFGDRFYFEHANQVGSFNPIQLAAIRQTTLARILCRTAYLEQVPAYAFLAVSPVNPAVNCAQLGEIDYNLF